MKVPQSNYFAYPHLGVAAKKAKNGRGGRRPGAGRKPVLKDPVAFTGVLERKVRDVLAKRSRQRGIPLAVLIRDVLTASASRRGRK